MSHSDFIALLKSDLKFSTTPGTSYEYSNLGYAILGEIISSVSGISYQSYIKSNILEPLNMWDTTYEISDVSSDKLAIGYKYIENSWIREPMLHDGAFGAMVLRFLFLF